MPPLHTGSSHGLSESCQPPHGSHPDCPAGKVSDRFIALLTLYQWRWNATVSADSEIFLGLQSPLHTPSAVTAARVQWPGPSGDGPQCEEAACRHVTPPCCRLRTFCYQNAGLDGVPCGAVDLRSDVMSPDFITETKQQLVHWTFSKVGLEKLLLHKLLPLTL